MAKGEIKVFGEAIVRDVAFLDGGSSLECQDISKDCSG
jgi:hypothetical protein